MTASPLVGSDELYRRNRDAFFWANVDKRGPDECWLWLRKPGSNGYGQLRGYHQQRHAHVFAWELAHGPIEHGLTVDHTCHTADKSCAGGPSCPHRLCCNPAHLASTTHAQNVKQGIQRRNERSGHTARVVSTRPCTYDACPALVYSLDLCIKHYRRLKRHGDPAIVKR